MKPVFVRKIYTGEAVLEVRGYDKKPYVLLAMDDEAIVLSPKNVRDLASCLLLALQASIRKIP